MAAKYNKHTTYIKWWPLLFGPAAMIWVYIAYWTHHENLVSRKTNEEIALFLLTISFINFFLQAVLLRSNFSLFMASLSAAFFCREWHFPGTSSGIYIALALLAVWAVKKKDEFINIIGNNLFKIWFIATFSTYLLSQLIARRVFRYVYLPQEDLLHIFLEETVETTAHLMLIVTSLALWKIKPRSAPS